jgi:hypothetical protein
MKGRVKLARVREHFKPVPNYNEKNRDLFNQLSNLICMQKQDYDLHSPCHEGSSAYTA